MTTGNIHVANGFNRIVHGGRGAYVEFNDDQILKDVLYVPKKERWRLEPGSQAYYDEYRTSDGVKVYHQKKTVTYADYKVGMWYISPVKLAPQFARCEP